MNISTIVFDMGGVVFRLAPEEAVRRFRALGLSDADRRLDKYHQQGIFGDLEEGKITAEEFREALSLQIGRQLTHEECAYAWQGYAASVPYCCLDTLARLRHQGYRLLLLSNTNSYMMEWALSDRFDGKGQSIAYYFDRLYLSYQHKMMKPDERFFRKLLTEEKLLPEEVLFIDDGPRNVAAASQLGMLTLCPNHCEDWTDSIKQILTKQ